MADLESLLGAIDLLGRVKAARAKVRARKARMRTVPKRPMRPSPVARPTFTKPKRPVSPRKRKVRAAVRKLPTPTKVAMVKEAIARKPELRKKLAAAIVKKKLQERMAMSPQGRDRTPVPAVAPSPEPQQDPAESPILEEEATPPSEAVEDEMNEGALEDTATEEADTEQAVEDAADDTAEEMDAEAEDLTEPTEEEAEEAAEEEVEDAAKAAETSGSELLGKLIAKKKAKVKLKSRARLATAAAIPTAKRIAKASNGKIPVQQTMKAIAVVAAAKAGNKKAKAAINQVAAKAKKGDAKSKKTLAQLKLSNKILAKGKTVAKRALPRAYSKPVPIVNQGLKSYSPYQRGMAMIPGIARSRYGS